jgi:hypothetical protein
MKSNNVTNPIPDFYQSLAEPQKSAFKAALINECPLSKKYMSQLLRDRKRRLSARSAVILHGVILEVTNRLDIKQCLSLAELLPDYGKLREETKKAQ